MKQIHGGVNMQEVKYFSPSTLDKGIHYLESNSNVTIFAGGTDLLVQREYGKIEPQNILNLTEIPDLKKLTEGEELRIGACVTMTEIQENDFIKNEYPFLADAASRLGSWHIRNTATIGGNLCNGAPSAELTPSLVVLDSKIVIEGPKGQRILPINEFLVGPGKTALKEGEILKEVVIPKQPDNYIGAYEARKWRRTMDVAIVNIAVLLVMDGDVVQEAKVCLGAVGPTAFRATKTEERLKGKALDETLIKEVSQIASEEAKPITDIRASAEYRTEMVKVCIKRALTCLQNREV